MAQLRYKKLPANSQAIRLLVLQPSLNFFAPIECTIRTTSIDPKARQDQSPYKALSYAWKDKAYLDSPSDEEPGTLPITCDGQTIIVSANLFLALRRLRQRLSPSCVWVDYLCINQADLEERSEQVSMMGNIFSCSDEVVVWLGESSHALEHVRYDWTGDGKDSIQIEEYRECFERWDNDLGPRVCDDADDEPRWAFGRRRAFGPPEAFGPRRAFDGLEDFKARMYRPDLATGVFGVFCLLSSLAQDGTISRMRFYESANFTAGQVKWSKLIKDALWALTERPWWRRTWVVQECVLARKAVIHCGGMTAPWGMFASAAKAYLCDRPQTDLLRITYDPLLSLSRLVLQIESARIAVVQRRPMPPLQVLRQFHSRTATDPRDKVLGLLGIMDNAQGPLVPPNYKWTKSQIYMLVAVNILSSAADLSFLAGSRPERGLGLPSWCVDWSAAPSGHERLRLQCLDLYTAAAALHPSVTLHNGSKLMLELDAFFVDEVSQVSSQPAPEDGFARLQATAKAWRNEMGDFTAPYWRCLCADVVYRAGSTNPEEGAAYRRAVSDDVQSFQLFLDNDEIKWRRKTTVYGNVQFGYVPPTEVSESRNQLFYATQTMSGGRRIFKTTNASLGVGPEDVQKGDLVFVVSGLPTPLLLRPEASERCSNSLTRKLAVPLGGDVSNTCSKQHTCYSIVGDTYMFGIMDGEAVEGRSASKISLI